MIRHGQSVSNLFESEHGPLLAHIERSLIDPKLTEVGRQEAIEKQALANQLDFSLIYVSPMRRTIETAYLIFKEHPKFHEI